MFKLHYFKRNRSYVFYLFFDEDLSVKLNHLNDTMQFFHNSNLILRPQLILVTRFHYINKKPMKIIQCFESKLRIVVIQ